MLRMQETGMAQEVKREVRDVILRRIEELEKTLARLHPQAEEAGWGWARVTEAREILRLVEAL